MDPILPLSPDGDATAQASPAVAMMRAAAEAKQRALSQQALQNQYKAAEEARMQTQGDLAAARERRIATQDQNADTSRTMANDLAQWSQDPSQPQYRASWDQAPAEVPAYVHQAYPGHEGEAASVWNRSVTQNTGRPTGVPTPDEGQVVSAEVAPGVHVQAGKVTRDPYQSWEKPSPELMSQADEAGVPLVDPTTGQPRKQSELRGDLQKWYAENGVLPPIQQKIVDRRNEAMTNSKEFKDATELNLAYANAKHLLASNPSDGQSQLALLENMARMQNPGVSVRQGMMQLLASHQGILGKINYDYLLQHAQEGSFLTPQTLANVEKLIDNTYSAKGQEWERSVLPQFRAGMRPELQAYVKSPFQQQPQKPAQPQPGQAQTVRMQSPEGDFYMIPAQNVEAAKQRGFK